LYKAWTDKTTGEIIHSASIITLRGHEALERIHRKSTPLWLPEHVYDEWLDPKLTDTGKFSDLLTPTLQTDLMATPIDKTFSKNPIAAPFAVSA
jgi:putative SOS response-associated peptidase YedK